MQCNVITNSWKIFGVNDIETEHKKKISSYTIYFFWYNCYEIQFMKFTLLHKYQSELEIVRVYSKRHRNASWFMGDITNGELRSIV